MAENAEKKLTRSLLLETLTDEKDQAALKLLFSSTINKDVAEQERMLARIFAERTAVGVELNSLGQNAEHEAIMQSLRFLGMDRSGSSYVEPMVISELAPKLLSKAFGEDESITLFNDVVNESILRHLENPDKVKFHPKMQDAIFDFMSKSRIKTLLKRVSDGRLDLGRNESNTQKLIDKIAVKYEFTEDDKLYLTQRAANDENGAEPDITDSEPEPAKVGVDSSKPDVSELAAQAENEYFKHQLDVDLRTDALMQLTLLMRKPENIGWAERNVVDKLKETVGDKIKDLYQPGTRPYSAESLFSNSLAIMDSGGRVDRELVTFSVNPLQGFKASVKDPNMGEDAYKAMALKAKIAGVSNPYIKSNFKDPKSFVAFMENTVDALISPEVGYSIDEIRVQPSLQPYFDAYIANKLQIGGLEQAPPDMVSDPDDPSVKMKNADPEAKRQQAAEDLIPEEIKGPWNTQQELLEMNSMFAERSKDLNNFENQLSIDDVSIEDKLSGLKAASLLDIPDRDVSNKAYRELGLTPQSIDFVRQNNEYFKNTLKLAKQKGPELGKGRQEALLAAEEILTENALAANNKPLADYVKLLVGQYKGVPINAPVNALDDAVDSTVDNPVDDSTKTPESKTEPTVDGSTKVSKKAVAPVTQGTPNIVDSGMPQFEGPDMNESQMAWYQQQDDIRGGGEELDFEHYDDDYYNANFAERMDDQVGSHQGDVANFESNPTAHSDVPDIAPADSNSALGGVDVTSGDVKKLLDFDPNVYKKSLVDFTSQDVELLMGLGKDSMYQTRYQQLAERDGWSVEELTTLLYVVDKIKDIMSGFLEPDAICDEQKTLLRKIPDVHLDEDMLKFKIALIENEVQDETPDDNPDASAPMKRNR
jgi:hypothetical protein